MCVQIEKVENNRVYLKKPSAPCPVEGPGKASVEMDGTIAEIDVYVNGTAWRKLPVPLSSEDISSAVDRATKEAGRLSLPENVHEEKAVQAAQDVTRFFQSKEFREKVDSMKQQLYRQAGDDHREDVAKTPTKAHKLFPDERLYLFVSSSVPVGTLRNYVQTLSNLVDPNIRIVLRGFVKGASRIGPTMSFLQEVLFVDPRLRSARRALQRVHCSGHYRSAALPAVPYREGPRLRLHSVGIGKRRRDERRHRT